jgi:uncharacterized tellurite resistance protein B-like protein
MLNILEKFFGVQSDRTDTDNDQNMVHDVYVATCALFLEMAEIDGKFSEAEKNNIVSVLKTEYGLSSDYTNEIIRAAHDERKGNIDLWHFTNKINRNYNIDEKIRITELIWKIIYTDGKLNKYEDYLIHKIGRLLNLRHSELIEAKLSALHDAK